MSLPRTVSYELPQFECPDRVDWKIDPARSVLLVHDMQEHFVRPFESADEPLRTAVPNIAALIADSRRAGIPVVYTAQPGDQDPEERALLTDFWGPGLSPENEDIIHPLAPQDGDVVLTKWRYSAFAKSDLGQRLKGWNRDQLIIAGVYAHIGVMATAIDAFMRDIQPFVVRDAVADFSEADHTLALEYVSSRCGKVETTDDVRALLR